jgi:5-methylthioadenosine/S-adenosylhomocysteine deaminase
MKFYLLQNCDIANFDTLKLVKKDILIKNDKIEQIADQITPSGSETIINADGMTAMPGFIDCHSHLMQTFCKGYLDDLPITKWLVRMFNIEDLMTEENNYYAVLLGCLESLRFGATAINDMCNKYLDSTIQAIHDSGIRSTIGLCHFDIAENESTPLSSVDKSLKEIQDSYYRYHGKFDDTLHISAAPAGLPACTKDLTQTLKSFTREKGLIFHTHLAEGKKETDDVRNRTGMGEAETLYEYGILDDYTLLAHSIWLEDYELDLIKKSNANPVHCPSTNMKISDGIPKIQSMLERGINVCFGCDGEASSSSRDMIREARSGAYLQKVVTLNPSAMDISATYKMLTQNGAKALHYNDIGSIEAGKKADLILLDTSKDISLVNQKNRLSNILYAGTGYAVDTVFVNGNMVVRNGELQTVNQSAVLEKCEKIMERLHGKIASLPL